MAYASTAVEKKVPQTIIILDGVVHVINEGHVC